MKKILLFVLLSLNVFGAGTHWYQGAGGNDANDGLSWANRKLTLASIQDSLDAEDTISTSGDNLTATLHPDVSGTGDVPAVSLAEKVWFMGVDASGNPITDSSTMAAITATAAIDTMIYLNATDDYFYFRNIYFNGNGNANYCIGTINADGLIGLSFKNCRASKAKKSNFILRSATPITICHCQLDSAGRAGVTGWGIEVPSITRTPIIAVDSRFFGNLTGGLQFGQFDVTNVIDHCEFYRNGIGVKDVSNTTSNCIITNNVFYSNTTGLDLPATVTLPIVRNNSFSTGTTGINTNTGSMLRYNLFCDYNNYYSLTNKIDINSGVPPGTHNTTGNPNFTSVTANAENFISVAPSALIDSGSTVIGY